MYILAQIFHYNFYERFGLNPRGMGMPQIFQNFYVSTIKGQPAIVPSWLDTLRQSDIPLWDSF